VAAFCFLRQFYGQQLFWNVQRDRKSSIRQALACTDQPNKSLQLTPQAVFWFEGMPFVGFASRW
jgi:hypothetical protein